MSAVTLVGLIAGAALIAAAIYVFVSKKEFSAGGVGVSLVGLILIGMSQWTNIKVKGGGVDIDLSTLREQVNKTATAVDAVAKEANSTAAVANETRDQLLSLSTQLERRDVLPAANTRAMRDSLVGTPRIDTTAVTAARRHLNQIIRE